MADDAQVKLLKDEGVAAWNAWREANRNTRPNLSLANLTGADLRGVNFIEANLQVAELGGANLRAADLREADLSRADLSMADLSWSNLSFGDLTEAILIGASLCWANLIRANISFGDLRRANLSGASLNRANLSGANLTETDLSNCFMDRSELGNVDLRHCRGLETIRHRGYSTIGIDTIYRSGGNIPEIFLRRAGVPEPFIAQMKSLVAATLPAEFYSCFISYSHADKAFARRLHDNLQDRGIRCWLDEHQLLPGDDMYHEIDRGIRQWDKMLLCCSEHSLNSWWVDHEIGTAFEKEQQLMKDRGAKVQVLVPLNLDGYLFRDKWKSGYQAQIRRRLAADFTDSGASLEEPEMMKFNEQLDKLIRSLRAGEGAREKPPEGRL